MIKKCDCGNDWFDFSDEYINRIHEGNITLKCKKCKKELALREQDVRFEPFLNKIIEPIVYKVKF